MANITYTEPQKNRRGMWEATVKEGERTVVTVERRTKKDLLNWVKEYKNNNKIIEDAEKTSSALSIIISDTDKKKLTKELLVEEAQEILNMFNSDGNMFADELHDDDADVRKEARAEKKRLERFIKKYSK